MSSSLIETPIIPPWIRDKGLTRCLVYAGSSMSPTFKTGDLLFVRPIALPALSVGDVVVFRQAAQDLLVVHRVIGVSETRPMTRGDANCRDDIGTVSPEELLGRVEGLERQRRYRSVAGGRAGMSCHCMIQGRHRACLLVGRLLRPIYGALRSSSALRRFLGRLFSAQLDVIHLRTPQGPLVKIARRGQTVAQWWPQSGRFECRKPYDLIISRPNERSASGKVSEARTLREFT